MALRRLSLLGGILFVSFACPYTLQVTSGDFSSAPGTCIQRSEATRQLLLAHRRNVRSAIGAALDQGANGVEVDVRRHRGDLILAHDPVIRDDPGLVRLAELYEHPHESLLVYLDFKEDLVSVVAEQVHLLGAFHRFVFFAERRDIVRSLAATKQRFPDLIADVSLLNVDVPEVEHWFGGLPEYVQIDLWTSPATRAYLASRTRLAFDTMLNIDLLSQLDPALGQWARHLLPSAILIQTDYPERFASACLRASGPSGARG